MKPYLILFATLAFSSTALALDPHVEAVTRTVKAAKGNVEKTEDGQSLKLVDLAVPGAGPHDHRKDDPYDAVFFEHLGHIATLESLNVISTKFNDEWMPHIAKLTRLKTLRFTNNAQFTDAGAPNLAKLTKLKGLELGSHATPAALKNITSLPLEYLQLGEGFDKSESLPIIKDIQTLKRLTLTNCKTTTDAVRRTSSPPNGAPNNRLVSRGKK